MTRRFPLPALLLLLLLAACGRGTPALTASGEADLVIRSGTSFGMCIGYCYTELTVSGTEATLTRTSREPERSPITHRLALRPSEWESLVALADSGALAGLQEVYGCPDCADGGAEWVEVQHDGQTRRVTFEHGATVPGIERLIARLRELRGRFPEPPTP